MSPSTAAAATPSPAAPRHAPQTPARRPVGPRRVSGPAGRPERVQGPTIDRAPSPAPFTQHVTRVVDNSLLDRLIRGRAWIGLVGFALIGIVAMQVTLLKLNAGIGRSIGRVTALQHESSALAAQVAGLSAAQRVQGQATGLGMVYAPPNDVRYLHVGPGDAARAATAFGARSASATSPSASSLTSGSGSPPTSSSTNSASAASAASPSSSSVSTASTASNTSTTSGGNPPVGTASQSDPSTTSGSTGSGSGSALASGSTGP